MNNLQNWPNTDWEMIGVNWMCCGRKG